VGEFSTRAEGSFDYKVNWTKMAQTIEQKYASDGHPSIEELQLAQRTIPTTDARELRGDFWPEGENINDFLTALRESRGHTETDQAA
jgi:hypothetical protein